MNMQVHRRRITSLNMSWTKERNHRMKIAVLDEKWITKTPITHKVHSSTSLDMHFGHANASPLLPEINSSIILLSNQKGIEISCGSSHFIIRLSGDGSVPLRLILRCTSLDATVKNNGNFESSNTHRARNIRKWFFRNPTDYSFTIHWRRISLL